jgi:hypothetical protein
MTLELRRGRLDHVMMQEQTSGQEPFVQTPRGTLSVFHVEQSVYQVELAADEDELTDKAFRLVDALQKLPSSGLFAPRDCFVRDERFIAVYELSSDALPLSSAVSERSFLVGAAGAADALAQLYGLDPTLDLWAPHTRLHPSLMFATGHVLAMGLWQMAHWLDENIRGSAMLSIRQSLSPDLGATTARTASFFLAEALWRSLSESEPFPFRPDQMFEEAKAVRGGELAPFVAVASFPVTDETVQLLRRILTTSSDDRSTPDEFAKLLRDRANSFTANGPNESRKPWWKKLFGR